MHCKIRLSSFVNAAGLKFGSFLARIEICLVGIYLVTNIRELTGKRDH